MSTKPGELHPYETILWKEATVHADSHVIFDRRLYSVPCQRSRHAVWVQATTSTVAILAEDIRIATHSRRDKGLRSTLDAHLPEHRRDQRHRSRMYWEQRAAQIGPEAEELANEIFDSDDVLSQLRTVQAFVTHLEGYPAERAEAGCRRARFYGTCTYRGIKSILAKALDLEPLPLVVLPPATPGDAPRHARNLRELIAMKLEVCDEPH